MSTSAKPESWARQSAESSEAFEAFVGYRDMGAKRSIRALARNMERNDSHLFEWSQKHQWQKRCADWNAFLDQQGRGAQIAEIKAMKKRQIKMAVDAQMAAAMGLSALIRKLQNDDGLVIKAEALAKLIDVGCRLERLNYDEPDSITKVQEADFSNLDTEEMMQLRALLEKSSAGCVPNTMERDEGAPADAD
jgi:hypothetical protein